LQEKIFNNILLFPGGFKPFHDGHLSILKSHIFNMDNVHINEIRIYISKKDRDFIKASDTVWFLNRIKKNIENIYDVTLLFSIPEYPSPIRQCYIDAGNEINNMFCLVSSDKESDHIRSIQFSEAFNVSGKYYDEEKGNRCFNINVDIEPIIFKKRTDENNYKPISSSILRNDVKNHDFKNFITGYTHMINEGIVDITTLKRYFLLLNCN